MDEYKNVKKLGNNDISEVSGGKTPMPIYKGRKPHFKHPMNIKPELLIKHAEIPSGQDV